MFYSQFILAKKGPLGTIWIAAHLERKLRKNQVADTDIGVSVDSILFPEVPIALRLSSHLLLGVVRIYSKKVNYLFDDCSEALLKVKQAFRSTAVDLPPEQSKAPYHSITLPETFDLDDFELPDNELSQGNFVDHHVSTREQITLQDTMDGVSFATSQFGPDERFGDGDASQIGLDLDEELLMDKVDGAGTSGILVETDVDPQESGEESSHSKGDELDEEVSNPPMASNTNYLGIQAPSTPGLTEEPNLVSSKEEIQVSDEHMDEDQNVSEVLAKEVSRTVSTPVDPSEFCGVGFPSEGNFHYMEEDNKQVKTFETGSTEFISSGIAQPAMFNEHLELNSDQNNVGINLNNKGIIDAGYNKADISGTYHLVHDTEVENNISSVCPAIHGTNEPVESVCEPQNSFPPCVSLQNAENFLSIVGEKSLGFTTPVLQACTSKLSSVCDGVDNVCDSSNLLVKEDLSSFGIAGREGAINVCEISSSVQDELEPTTKEDQTTHGVTSATHSQLEGSQDNLIREETNFEKEINLELSNFPPPELLLSIPNLPAGPSHNFVVDFTPGREVFAKDCDENLLSGKKRSLTESTLTMQSVNSVESSGRAQSKGTVEFAPDDNDLLSSILVGTGLKMKPTPPVPSTVRAKRQRTATRSVFNKRKVLIDDSTVLHGDTIRQQLTNTEEICRVRKKAPCTHLEVWVLQKQFLEDEIFSESIFTGMVPALQSMDKEPFDLTEIRILRDHTNKEANEADISTMPTIGEPTEAIVPSSVVISKVPNLNEETEDITTLTSPSGGKLLETLCEKQPSFVVDGTTLLEDTQKVDNGIMKEISHSDIFGEKTSVEFDHTRISDNGEAVQSVASCDVRESSEINRKSTDNDNIESTPVDQSGDVAMSMNFDESGQLLDQRSPTHRVSGDVSTMEDVSVSGTRDEWSVGQHILDKREGFDVTLVDGNVQASFSLPDLDLGGCGTTHLDGVVNSNKDENIDSGQRNDDSYLAPNNIGDHATLDLSFSVEKDLGSQKTLGEMEDPPYWEDDPKIVMDSTFIHTESIEAEKTSEFGTGVIEHDTDFLNVDDDVAEDYESDMPDPEEKRILDNSGWSSRSRAVANYLQVLFEEYDHAKKVVFLDNLLVGKTRKEASRMFFETLVLKTKDYIQTEQENSFCDIKITPRGKLLKSEFGS